MLTKGMRWFWSFLFLTFAWELGACDSAQPGADGGSGGTSAGGATSGGGSGGAETRAGGTSNGGAGGADTSNGGAGGAEARAGGTSSGGAGGADSSTGGASAGGAAGDGELDVLVFSRTVEYRHASIEDGIAALQILASERGWRLTATEDAAMFEPGALATFDVVVFLSTTGDVLDATEQAAFEEFIRSGKGYVGVHAASDTEYDWPWYGDLVGAYFSEHPDIQEASVLVEDAAHAATSELTSPWVRTDEWYNFADNPRDTVQVLLTLDESTYDAGPGAMGTDHPIAWCREYDGGRSFYTALGHTALSFSEPAFLSHLAGGIEWAAGKLPL